MARFTSTVALNIKWFGHELVGPPGTVHRISDALYDEFVAQFGVPGLVPGLVWVTVDDLDDPATLIVQDFTADTATIGGLVTADTATIDGLATIGSIVVGASTATSSLFKGEPWFDVRAYGALVDGTTDDTTAYQATLDAASAAGGGRVRSPEGTAIVSSLSVASNVELFGVGPASVIKSKAQAGVGVTAVTLAGAGAALRDLTVDGNRANITTEFAPGGVRITAAGCSVERVTVKAVKSYGIFALDVGRVKVKDCHVSDTRFTGIFVQCVTPASISDIDIDGNTVDRSADSAATIPDPGIDIHGTTGTKRIANARVRGNHVFMPTNPTDAAAICIQLFGGIDRAAVFGNTLSGGSMGISLNATVDSSCADNAIYGADLYGIELADTTQYNSITGNVIDGNSLTNQGIIASATSTHNVIAGNVVRRCTTAGIQLNTGSNFTTITGNHLQHPSNYVINVISSINIVISGNTLDGLATCGIGVMLDHTSGVTITGNMFLEIATDCVQIYAVATTITELLISGNHFGATATPITPVFSGGAVYGARVAFLDNLGLPLNTIDALAGYIEQWGTGTPEGAISAAVGSVFHRTDGGASTSLYIKTSGTGNTGWTAK